LPFISQAFDMKLASLTNIRERFRKGLSWGETSRQGRHFHPIPTLLSCMDNGGKVSIIAKAMRKLESATTFTLTPSHDTGSQSLPEGHGAE
jgi:hypothetical protein